MSGTSASSVVRIILAGSHEAPAMAGDRDLGCLTDLLRAETISASDYLIWLGECDPDLQKSHSKDGPLVDTFAFGDNTVQLTKHNAKHETKRLGSRLPAGANIEVYVCAPLRYLDQIWWAFGATPNDVHAFGLVWLLREIIADAASVRVKLHLFRSWSRAGNALPVDLPDDSAAAALAVAFNVNTSTKWTCETSFGEACLPHERTRSATQYQPPNLYELLHGRSTLALRQEEAVDAPLLIFSPNRANEVWLEDLQQCARALQLSVRVVSLTDRAARALVVLDDRDLTHESGNRDSLRQIALTTPVVLFGHGGDGTDAAVDWRLPAESRGPSNVPAQLRWLAYKLGIVERAEGQRIDDVLLARAQSACDALARHSKQCAGFSLQEELARNPGQLHMACELVLDSVFQSHDPQDRNEKFWFAVSSVLQLWRELLTFHKAPPLPDKYDVLLSGSPKAVHQLMDQLRERSFTYSVLDAKTWKEQLQQSNVLLCAVAQEQESGSKDEIVTPANLAEILANVPSRLKIAAVCVGAAATRWRTLFERLDKLGSVVAVPNTEWLSEMLGFVDDYFSGEKVFISYSSADEACVDPLKKHLQLVQKSCNLRLFFAPVSLQPGNRWRQDLVWARAAAGVAIMFTSVDFLTSQFVLEHEYRQLLREHERRDLELCWHAVRPHHPDKHLAEIQHWPRGPMSTLDTNELEGLLVEIAQRIHDLVRIAVEKRARLRAPQFAAANRQSD